jgi:hypothetical protein
MGLKRFTQVVILIGCILFSGCDQAAIEVIPSPTAQNVLGTARSALEVVAAAENLADLVAQEKVTFAVNSGSINELGLTLRNTSDRAVQLVIPPGTFFVNRDPNSQNMVVLHPVSVSLPPKEQAQVQVEVACANLHRVEPTQDDQFLIQSFPTPITLRGVVNQLAAQKVDFPVAQAAVWIVTDDASYDELGLLVKDSRFGSSVITVDDAVQALRIVAEAGVPIDQFAIWEDLGKFTGKVTDSSSSAWLSDRLATKVVLDATQSIEETRQALATPSITPTIALTPTLSAAAPAPQVAATLSSGEIAQFASGASASSQYSDSAWSAQQATGAPNTDACGDINSAWTSSSSRGEDWLVLDYDQAVIPTQILIYETFNPGAVTKVEVFAEDGSATTVYTALPVRNATCPNTLAIEVSGVDTPVLAVRVSLEHSAWSEIDAVQLIGKP